MQAEHIPVHLGAMPAAVGAVLGEDHSPGRRLDPQRPVPRRHAPARHHGDLAGLRDEGELIGFAASRAHHADVGGREPGSMPADSRTLEDEGVVIPPTRLDRATSCADLTSRMRDPRQREADLRAQLAANRAGAERLVELLDRHGLDTFRAAMDETLDYAERRTRAAIEELEDGERTATDVLEAARRRPRADAARHRRGRRARARLQRLRRAARRQPQLPARRDAVGLLLRAARARRPRRAAVRRRLPAAHGARARGLPAQRRARRRPWPPATWRPPRAWPTSCWPAFGRALGQGTMNNLTLGNDDFTYYETLGGGQGACADADGPSAVHVAMSNTLNTPVEALELEFPLRAVEYAVRRGSGGAGAPPRRRRRGARGGGARHDALLADHRAPPARAAGRGRRRRPARRVGTC